jgi:hypothetical protein
VTVKVSHGPTEPLSQFSPQLPSSLQMLLRPLEKEMRWSLPQAAQQEGGH